MIEVRHENEPASLARYRRNNPCVQWGEDSFRPVREKTRHVLHDEQQGLCVYCEQKIDRDDGHVEHIKPRCRYPDLCFDYKNLVHSCNGRDHCGHFKGNSEISIEPRPGCNRYFQIKASDGKLVAAEGLEPNEQLKAEETLAILGLNVPRLAWQRKRFALTLQYLDQGDRQEFISASPFRHMLMTL